MVKESKKITQFEYFNQMKYVSPNIRNWGKQLFYDGKEKRVKHK